MSKTFTLTDEQTKKFDEFRKEINKEYFDTTAIGGAYTFCFTPTGLGTMVKVKHVNGKEIDITDEDEFC